MSNSAKRLMEEYNINKVINYLRKSRQDEEREKKTGEDTLHEQKLLMDRILESYEVLYDQRSEIGSGDKISSRPVFQSIIDDLRDKKYDAIAVKEMSRMGRGSYTDMGIIYDLIQEHSIYIITPYKIYDPKNPSDLRQIRFELFMSREEFETTRERLSGGRYNAALEGKWVAGQAPLGFDYNKATKRLVINDKEAEFIRLLFNLYAYGIYDGDDRRLVGLQALSTYVNRLGYKSKRGARFTSPTVKSLLENERYIGKLKFKTTKRTSDGRQVPRDEDEHIYVDDACPAIIDQDLWRDVQQRLNSRDVVPASKLDFSPCELASLCVCNVCGRKMVRQYSVQHYQKEDGTTSIYHKEFLWCTTTACTFVKYRQVEDELKQILKTLISLEDKDLSVTLDHYVIDQKPEDQTEELKKNLTQSFLELDRRMDFIFEKYEKGIYSDAIFLERKSEIDKRRNELESISFDKPEEKEEVNLEDVRTNLKNVLDAYNRQENKTKKNDILRTVFDYVNISIIAKGRGRRPARIEYTPYLRNSILKPRLMV